jgi:hypothetical protein
MTSFMALTGEGDDTHQSLKEKGKSLVAKYKLTGG